MTLYYDDAAEFVRGDVDDKIVDALLRPYLGGALAMAESEHASEAEIDTAMTLGCGPPKGPFAMLAERS